MKVYLSIVGFSLLCRINAYSQTKPDSVFNKPAIGLYAPADKHDSTTYNPKLAARLMVTWYPAIITKTEAILQLQATTTTF